MSILANLFGGNQQQQQAPADPVDPPVEQGQPNPPVEPEGLDRFLDFASQEVQPTETFDPAKLFNVDPAKMSEEVNKMNFLEGAVTREQLAQIQEGGEKANVAMLEVINQVARQSFARAAHMSTAVTTNALTQSLPHVQSMMGQTLEQTRLQDAIEAVNPALAHPVGKLFLKDAVPRLKAQYPKATNTEIAKHANELFMNFASAISPQNPNAEAEQKKAADIDWDEWLDS